MREICSVLYVWLHRKKKTSRDIGVAFPILAFVKIYLDFSRYKCKRTKSIFTFSFLFWQEPEVWDFANFAKNNFQDRLGSSGKSEPSLWVQVEVQRLLYYEVDWQVFSLKKNTWAPQLQGKTSIIFPKTFSEPAIPLSLDFS